MVSFNTNCTLYSLLKVLDDHMLVFDPREQSSPDYYHRKRRQGRDMLKKANRDIRFAFDQVYGMGASNTDVYERTTKTALDALIDGFNCSGSQVVTHYNVTT